MLTGLLSLPQIGRRLARIDRHLLHILKMRIGTGSLSEAVAENKQTQILRAQGADVSRFPKLTRKGVEEERIAMAATLAERQGIDPNVAALLQTALILESCRVQSDFFSNHSADVVADISDPEKRWQFHREQLLALTEQVAPGYDSQYENAFLATRTARRFERTVLAGLIVQTTNRDLALDLGCATGRQTFRLAESFKQVIGYDISPAMLAQAQANQATANGKGERCEFISHDLENPLPLADGLVSLVAMNNGTAADIRNIDGLLSEIHRVLRPGGKFLLSFYNAESLLAQLGFLPWQPMLAAMVDPEKNCLDVAFGNQVFLIYARPYRVSEVEQLLASHQLKVGEVLTHPTVCAVLPGDVLEEYTFDGFEPEQATVTELVDGKAEQRPRRDHRAKLNLVRNEAAEETLATLDEHLARQQLHLGAYIIVTGSKKS